MKIAFLGCKHNLTTSRERWPDAFEHSRELAAFTAPFAAAGLVLEEADWRQVDPARAAFDLYFVRTTWDYKDTPGLFAAFLADAARHAPVANDPGLITWNMSKRYLAQLEGAGLPVIPSAFVEAAQTTIAQLRARLGADDLVLKPLYGGGGFGMKRVAAGDDGNEVVPDALFAQPFMPDILDEGELSFIFVEDTFSHALRKLPAPGHYLIHTHHGGREEAYHPSTEEIDACRSFLAAMPAPALAARVDVVPHEGRLMLMELEVIEPHLFPLYNPQLGDMLAAACRRRLG